MTIRGWAQNSFYADTRNPPGSDVQVSDFAPDKRLAPYIDRYWIMKWRRDDAPLLTRIIPVAASKLLFNFDALGNLVSCWVTGVSRKSSALTLYGSGTTVGVAFHPGMLSILSGKSSSVVGSCGATLKSVFPNLTNERIADLARSPISAIIKKLDQVFLKEIPATYHHLSVSKITNWVYCQPIENLSLKSLQQHSGLTERSLQRLCRDKIGISPTFLMRLARTHKTIMNREKVPFAGWASELGYYDQSHFINEIKAITGWTPVELGHHMYQFPKLSEFSNTGEAVQT